MNTNQYEMRFGIIAIEKGFINKNQLIEVIGLQVEDEIEKRRPKLIGTILSNLGYITHKQIDEIIKAQRGV